MKMTAIEKHFVNKPGHTRSVAAHAMELLGHIDPQPGWRYLDAGCGVGAAAGQIAGATSLEVTGIDVDPKQVAAAQQRESRQNLRFSVMDATQLNFPDGAFDIVATSMTTHHIPNWERALSEMVRVLRPGGYLIYSDHVFPNWLAKAARRLIRFMGLPTESMVDAAAAKAGLTAVFGARRSGHVEVIWLKAA